MPKKGVTRIGVSLPPELLETFDRFIEEKGYQTRSKAIADLVRDRLTQEEWRDDEQEVIGAVSLVYDHHTRDLSAKLTEIQHDAHDQIVSTTHVHTDHHRCLEILIIRGIARNVRQLGEHLISVRGVLHGKMIFTTTGRGLR